MSFKKALVASACTAALASTAVAMPANAQTAGDDIAGSAAFGVGSAALGVGSAIYTAELAAGLALTGGILYVAWYALTKPAPGTAPINIPALNG